MKVKIHDCNKLTKLIDLKIGDCFYLEEDYYMVVSICFTYDSYDIGINSVIVLDIESGTIHIFNGKAIVIPVDLVCIPDKEV